MFCIFDPGLSLLWLHCGGSKHLGWVDHIVADFDIIYNAELLSLLIIYYLLKASKTKHKSSRNQMKGLNRKQACMFAFIDYNKVYIVTIIAFDVSGVTILINIDLLIPQSSTTCIQDYG